MNNRFHTPSFGDDVFDLGDAPTSTPTSNFVAGNHANYNSPTYMYQQTPPSTKRRISAHSTSDEYHTANEESFNVTANNTMNNSITHQNINTSNNVLPGGQAPTAGPTTMAARKQMLPVDQNEPAKPLSAYALFFRDTVSAIKQQNPTCSFQELSKIVASMWDALDPVHKGVYNKKNELARTEYLKQLRIYQQQQQQKQEELNASANEVVQNDAHVQQPTQQVTQPVTNNINVQESIDQVNNNINPNIVHSSAPSNEQLRLLTEAGSAQICTRQNCNKRAIINPDWEDEYCSNECVVIHCRNVFNEWVQSNLEAKQQQITQHTTTT